jgi:UDP-glucose 4-epimerase
MFDGNNPPYEETMDATPSSPYGISKRCGELLLNFYHKQHHINHTILRYANVY